MLEVMLLVIVILAVGVLFLVFSARKDVHRKPASQSMATRAAVSTPSPKAVEKPKPVRPQFEPVQEAEYVDSDTETIGGDFYAEVAELLIQVIEDSPDRQDLRLKLIDVYFDSGQKDKFISEAENYRSHMGKSYDSNWAKVLEMGKRLAPGHELFGGTSQEAPVEPEEPQSGGDKEIRRFGDVPEATAALHELADSYQKLRTSSQYYAQLDLTLTRTAARPSRLVHAQRLSDYIGGARIYIKREDVSTGQFPRLRTQLMGQAWIARQLGKEKLLFAANSGDEAVIAAQAAAKNGMECTIYVAAKVGKYREPHKYQVQIMGSEFIETQSGTKSHDIRDAALTSWLEDPDRSFMMLNLAAGPHPYPTISADLQSVIGRESIRQIKGKTSKLPRAILARAGNRADAIGFVEPYLASRETDIVLVSPSDSGIPKSSDISSSEGIYGLLYSNKQEQSADYILEHIEFPSVKRELSMLAATGRLQHQQVDIGEAKHWIKQSARTEGLIFPMETAHVLAFACNFAKTCSQDESLIVMLAEQLDKDLMGVSALQI